MLAGIATNGAVTETETERLTEQTVTVGAGTTARVTCGVVGGPVVVGSRQATVALPCAAFVGCLLKRQRTKTRLTGRKDSCIRMD